MAGGDTHPKLYCGELRLLAARGYRKHVFLPGGPDLLFPRAGSAGFVDGCFWHGYPRHFKAPKNNVEYWTQKISYNKTHDRQNDRRLRRLGYSVLHVWQHRITSDPARTARAIVSTLERISSPELQKLPETDYSSPSPAKFI